MKPFVMNSIGKEPIELRLEMVIRDAMHLVGELHRVFILTDIKVDTPNDDRMSKVYMKFTPGNGLAMIANPIKGEHPQYLIVDDPRTDHPWSKSDE